MKQPRRISPPWRPSNTSARCSDSPARNKRRPAQPVGLAGPFPNEPQRVLLQGVPVILFPGRVRRHDHEVADALYPRLGHAIGDREQDDPGSRRAFVGFVGLSPGSVCHALVIPYNAAQGHKTYDLLVGDSQYKKSLSTHANQLVWYTIQKPRLRFKLEGLAKAAKAWLKEQKPNARWEAGG